MNEIRVENLEWSRRVGRNRMVALAFLSVALFFSWFPAAMYIGSQNPRCPDGPGWTIAAAVFSVLVVVWVVFLIKHAIGAIRSGVRIEDGKVLIRNITGQREFAVDEVDRFEAGTSNYEYHDEFFFTALLLGILNRYGTGMPDSEAVQGVSLHLKDGEVIPIWSLMDNTDDASFSLRKQKARFDWEFVAAELNDKLAAD